MFNFQRWDLKEMRKGRRKTKNLVDKLNFKLQNRWYIRIFHILRAACWELSTYYSIWSLLLRIEFLKKVYTVEHWYALLSFHQIAEFEVSLLYCLRCWRFLTGVSKGKRGYDSTKTREFNACSLFYYPLQQTKVIPIQYYFSEVKSTLIICMPLFYVKVCG
jgi:hypothetical protein